MTSGVLVVRRPKCVRRIVVGFDGSPTFKRALVMGAQGRGYRARVVWIDNTAGGAWRDVPVLTTRGTVSEISPV